ncbi:MAG: IS200/IS605 family transposase [Candidatus ainarchaeum sp.]|nr:IS200/IS605 family transposase [Candidatus ainarchaeum sp.]
MASFTLFESAHCVGESNLHLQFTPKYRKPVFEDEVVRKACELAFQGVAAQLKVVLSGIGFGPDHAHLFVKNWKNYSIVELARRFKGAVSHALRKAYPERLQKYLWGNAFWTGGYFYRTVGAVTVQAMRKYVIESQQKHWKKTNTVSEQTTLMHFN